VRGWASMGGCTTFRTQYRRKGTLEQAHLNKHTWTLIRER